MAKEFKYLFLLLVGFPEAIAGPTVGYRMLNEMNLYLIQQGFSHYVHILTVSAK